MFVRATIKNTFLSFSFTGLYSICQCKKGQNTHWKIHTKLVNTFSSTQTRNYEFFFTTYFWTYLSCPDPHVTHVSWTDLTLLDYFSSFNAKEVEHQLVLKYLNEYLKFLILERDIHKQYPYFSHTQILTCNFFLKIILNPLVKLKTQIDLTISRFEKPRKLEPHLFWIGTNAKICYAQPVVRATPGSNDLIFLVVSVNITLFNWDFRVIRQVQLWQVSSRTFKKIKTSKEQWQEWAYDFTSEICLWQ